MHRNPPFFSIGNFLLKLMIRENAELTNEQNHGILLLRLYWIRVPHKNR